MGIKKGDELILFQEKNKILIEKSNKLRDEFRDLLKFSEKSLGVVWDNKEDDIWNSYLEK